MAERLNELKAEEEENTKLRLETEEIINNLPRAEYYTLSKTEYAGLKKDLSAFIEEAPPHQKRLFLSKFLRSITVHPEKIVVAYVPPIFNKKKSPGQEGQGDFLIRLASPTGFEPVSPA